MSIERDLTITTLIDNVNKPTISRATLVGDVKKAFQVIINGKAKVCIESSIDGKVFNLCGDIIWESRSFSDNSPYPYYRANVAEVTRGTVSVYMSTGVD